MELKAVKYILRIRQGTADDICFCHDLAHRNMVLYVDRFWGGWDSKRYRNDLNVHNIKIITLNDRRIGFCNCEKREKYFFVVDMQLSRNFQGKGIGRSLLKMAESEANKEGCKKIRLEVFKDNPAVKLYKDAGFKKLQDKEHSLVMEKKI